MFDILGIASRNLLRYRRRTLLTLLLIVIGMVAVLLFIASVLYVAVYLWWEGKRTGGMAYYGQPLAARRALALRCVA